MFGVPGPLGAKLGNFELGGWGARAPGPGPGPDRASKKGPITVFLKSAKTKNCSFSRPTQRPWSRGRPRPNSGVNEPKTPNLKIVVSPPWWGGFASAHWIGP